jgi:antitoxin CptB
MINPHEPKMNQARINHELRLKRLHYRSVHRGCKETDLVLGRFAQAALSGLEPPMIAVYERLLDENDVDIWDWLTGKSPPADAEYAPLLAMIKSWVAEHGSLV